MTDLMPRASSVGVVSDENKCLLFSLSAQDSAWAPARCSRKTSHSLKEEHRVSCLTYMSQKCFNNGIQVISKTRSENWLPLYPQVQNSHQILCLSSGSASNFGERKSRFSPCGRRPWACTRLFRASRWSNYESLATCGANSRRPGWTTSLSRT